MESSTSHSLPVLWTKQHLITPFQVLIFCRTGNIELLSDPGRDVRPLLSTATAKDKGRKNIRDKWITKKKIITGKHLKYLVTCWTSIYFERMQIRLTELCASCHGVFLMPIGPEFSNMMDSSIYWVSKELSLNIRH